MYYNTYVEPPPKQKCPACINTNDVCRIRYLQHRHGFIVHLFSKKHIDFYDMTHTRSIVTHGSKYFINTGK